MAFGYLPGASTEDYATFFTLLKETIAQKLNSTGIRLRKVLCDFELSIHNGITDTFGTEVEINGCYFHFSQCLYRKVLDSGMKSDYAKPGSHLKKFVKMCIGLAQCPPNRLREAYIILKNFKLTDHRQVEFKEKFLAYINQQWLNNEHMQPSKWNCFLRKNHYSNNAMEAFNGRLKKRIKVYNPNPYLLLMALKREMIISCGNIRDYEAGAVSKKVNKSRRLLKILESG